MQTHSITSKCVPELRKACMQLLEMGVSFEAALTALPKHPPFMEPLLWRRCRSLRP